MKIASLQTRCEAAKLVGASECVEGRVKSSRLVEYVAKVRSIDD